jgi:hypothetical protein
VRRIPAQLDGNDMAPQLLRWHLGVVSLIALIALAVPAPPAHGAANQFEVTVPLTADGEEAAFKAGMADLLVRITGRRDAAQLPGLAPLVDNAPRYVSSYRRAPGRRLLINFDEDAVEAAVAEAGLPFWGDVRPTTLVWLAVDRGGGRRGLVMSDTSGEEKDAVEAAAAQRGLPLVWPSAGAGEDPRLRFEQAWSGDAASLAQTASRYGAEGVLVGKAITDPAGASAVEWTFVGDGGLSQARGGLDSGVHLAADRYASRYASTAGARRSEIDITVSGVTHAAAYADAWRRLEALAAVRDLRLVRVLPDSAVFRASVRGGLDALQREAAAGGRLRPVAGEQGAAQFVYEP